MSDEHRPIRMGVLCGCGDVPVGMNPMHIFNMDIMGGKGYHWECPACGNQILVNLEELDADQFQTKLEDFE